MLDKILGKRIMEKFTERELIVLKLVVEGYSNNQIAQEIFVSSHTVKAHMSAIIRKLNAKTRTNAVDIAAKSNIIK